MHEQLHPAPTQACGDTRVDWHEVSIAIDAGTRLRAWRGDDLEALVAHANDAEVSAGVSDRFPHPYTREDAVAFLEGRVVDFGQPTFAIEIEGEACGGIDARAGSGERRHCAELGYWPARRYWGQGRMTRIVGVFAPWAMRTLRLHRLQATVLDANRRSARVLLNNRFVEEGIQRHAVLKRGRLHDLRVFALTRTRLDDDA